jgi:hypothetical protein
MPVLARPTSIPRPWEYERWLALGPWQRLALMVWAILAFLAIGRAALYHLPRHQGCYLVFADAGRHWLAGEDLYDRERPESRVVFRYSPLVAACLAPLAWLPDLLGCACLRAVSVVAFLTSLWWWSCTALPRSCTGEMRAGFFLLCAAMANNSFLDVQLNLLTASMLLLTMAAVSTERWSVAAVTVSLACCLKAYPIALALLLAVLFPRRFAGRFVLALAMCLALPFALQEPGYVWRQYQDWVHWGLNQRLGNELSRSYQDLMCWCRTWLVPIDRTTYVWLEIAGGGGIAALCVWQRRRGVPGQELLNYVFALACAWMMVLGPATESTTYVLLAPAVAAAAVAAWVTPRSLGIRLALVGCCILLAATELELMFPLGNPLRHLGTQPFATLLFVAAVAPPLNHGVEHRRQEDAEQSHA